MYTDSLADGVGMLYIKLRHTLPVPLQVTIVTKRKLCIGINEANTHGKWITMTFVNHILERTLCEYLR